MIQRLPLLVLGFAVGIPPSMGDQPPQSTLEVFSETVENSPTPTWFPNERMASGHFFQAPNMFTFGGGKELEATARWVFSAQTTGDDMMIAVPYEPPDFQTKSVLWLFSHSAPRSEAEHLAQQHRRWNRAVIDWQRLMGDMDESVDPGLVEIIDFSQASIRGRSDYRIFPTLKALALPFRGVEHEEEFRFPDSLEQLVVYNTVLTKAMIAELDRLPALRRLVLWGCSVMPPELDDAPPSRPRVLQPAAPVFGEHMIGRLAEVEIYHCCPELTQALQFGVWENLVSISANDLIFLPFNDFAAMEARRRYGAGTEQFPSLQRVELFHNEDFNKGIGPEAFLDRYSVGLRSWKREGTVHVLLHVPFRLDTR